MYAFPSGSRLIPSPCELSAYATQVYRFCNSTEVNCFARDSTFSAMPPSFMRYSPSVADIVLSAIDVSSFRILADM